MKSELEDWIALNLVPGIGPRSARLLLDRWNQPTAIFQAQAAELSAVGINQESIDALLSEQPRRDAAKHCQQLTEMGASALTLNDSDYPRLLREIHDPPPILYFRGDFQRAYRQPAIAIVGSRRCTAYGKQVAEMLAGELAERGITIVSGLARGIDAAAHRAALAAGGQTIAVMGNGLDTIYPKENSKLAQAIEKSGALITELPLGAPPLPQNFPFRNRIIAGLCLGVLIVEAADRSGSLITARLAMEQNREVFAVPGNITVANSFGPNYLIKDGAKLVQSWRDIVEELPIGVKARILADSAQEQPAAQQELFPPTELSLSERKIYDLIKADAPLHIDELAYASGLGPSEVLGALFALEVKAKIKQLPGKNFVRTS